MNTILVIDTATEKGVVAAIQGKQLLFHAQLPPGMQSASYLLPCLQQELLRHHLDLTQVSLIAVGIGPGSYTGIRIGATVAKTLSLTHAIPLVGVCSLEGFVPSQEGFFAVVIDAKIGGVYLQIAEHTAARVVVTTPPQVLPLAEVFTLLRGIPLLITPRKQPLQQKMESISLEYSWQWQESYPSPQRLAMRALEKFERGEWNADGDIELLYMRKTQAELERESFDKKQKPL